MNKLPEKLTRGQIEEEWRSSEFNFGFTYHDFESQMIIRKINELIDYLQSREEREAVCEKHGLRVCQPCTEHGVWTFPTPPQKEEYVCDCPDGYRGPCKGKKLNVKELLEEYAGKVVSRFECGCDCST